MRSGCLRNGAVHGLAGASSRISPEHGFRKTHMEDVKAVAAVNGVSDAQSMSPIKFLRTLVILRRITNLADTGPNPRYLLNKRH